MEALQNRIESFAKTKTKRVKTGQKSRTITLKWPHPPTFLANPAALAEAGFYYSPSVEDQDGVICFECEKQLSEWEEQDDPFEVHFSKCGYQCSWAAVRCGLRIDLDRHKRFTFPDKSRLPGTKKMEEARLGTFKTRDGWVHDQVKNHGASSRKMAKAGFVWAPQHPGDDLATCLYCNIALSGWEKDDDPMEEHRKRGKSGETCPFLSYTNNTLKMSSSIAADSTTADSEPAPKLTRSTSMKPPSRSQSKTAVASSRSRASKQNKAGTMSPQRTKGVTENDDDEEFQSQGAASEDKDVTCSTSVKPLSRNQSKMAAPPSKSGASKISKSRIASSQGKKDDVAVGATTSDAIQRKSHTVANEEVMDIVDNKETQSPSQPASSEEDELDFPVRLTRSTSMKPSSKNMSKAEGPSRSPRASRTTKKGMAVTRTRRNTHKAVDEVVMDVVHDEKVQPRGHPASEEEEESDLRPQRMRSMSMKPSSKSNSKTEAALPRSRTSRARKKEAGTGRHKTRNIAVEDTVDNKDALLPTQPALEDVQLLSIRATQTIPDQLMQSVSVNQPSSTRLRNEPDPLQSQIPETAKTNTPSALGTSQCKTHDGRLDDVDMGQAQDEEKKASILQKTPPTAELFSLNFASNPEQDLHIPIAVPPSALPTSEAFLVPLTEGDILPEAKTPQGIQPMISDEVAPKLKAPEPQILPPLSRIPFMPLSILTDAELDMTVEEWIHYQMEVEFDKLKRDGEKEMARFRARAEEVRKMIESL